MKKALILCLLLLCSCTNSHKIGNFIERYENVKYYNITNTGNTHVIYSKQEYDPTTYEYHEVEHKEWKVWDLIFVYLENGISQNINNYFYINYANAQKATYKLVVYKK